MIDILKVSTKHRLNIEVALIFLGMLYVTINTISDFLFFRQVTISHYGSFATISPSAAAFSWPLTYIISDVVLVISKRKFALFIIGFGTFCDALFGLLLQWIPDTNSSVLGRGIVHSLNLLGPYVWLLVYTGIISTVLTAILEIIIFSAVYKKLDKFVTSAIVSITVTLLIRTFIGDYFTIKNEPNVIKILISNLVINIIVLICYMLLLKVSIKLFKLYNNQFLLSGVEDLNCEK